MFETKSKLRDKIKQLENENQMLLDRNEVCGKTVTDLTVANVELKEDKRDLEKELKSRQSDLSLWEPLANEIQRHNMPFISKKLTVPGKGVELISFYSSRHAVLMNRLTEVSAWFNEFLAPERQSDAVMAGRALKLNKQIRELKDHSDGK